MRTIAMIVLFAASCAAQGIGVGRASWYGKAEQGKTMANGHRFNRQAPTAASYAYPLGTKLRVYNLKTGAQIVVTVTDRGPAKHLHRLIDLSESSARVLGYHDAGTAPVMVAVLQ